MLKPCELQSSNDAGDSLKMQNDVVVPTCGKIIFAHAHTSYPARIFVRRHSKITKNDVVPHIMTSLFSGCASESLMNFSMITFNPSIYS